MSAHSKTARLFLYGTMACWLTYSASSAANIEVFKFFEIGATATDNLELLDGDGASELVLNVSPAVELKYAGNRFGIVARGEVDYLRFTDAEDDIVDPRLLTKLSGTLIDNLLFLDASLVVSQITDDGDFVRLSDADDNIAATFKNTTFLDHSFGRVADFYLAHTFTMFADEADDSFESNRNVIDFNLERNPQYGGFLWGLSGSYSVDSSDLNEFSNSSVYAKLGTTLSQTLLAELRFGIERRDLEADEGSDLTANANAGEEESNVWQLDFTWTPSEFTSLTAGYGERFFGRGPTFELKHRVRNSRIVASYTRDITRQTASLDGISNLGGTLNPTISNPDSIELDNGSVASQLDEPFIDNRFRLAYKLAGRRSDFIVDAVYSEQERLDSSEEINTLLGRVVFDRQLSNFLSLRLQYNHQISESESREALNYTENRFAVKLIYHFDGVSEFEDDELEID